jgi:hypothetical protein
MMGCIRQKPGTIPCPRFLNQWGYFPPPPAEIIETLLLMEMTLGTGYEDREPERYPPLRQG